MAKPLIFGLIGHPVSQSLSPRLHQAAFAYTGLSGEYKLFDIPPSELAKRIADLIGTGVIGFNITIPHKQALYNMVNSRSQEADRVGAINAVKVLNDGYLEGHNTDYDGLKLALAQDHPLDFAGKCALLLGAGGAALAAAAAVYNLGFAKLRVLARDPERQRAFIDFVRERQNNLAKAKHLTVIEPDQQKYWNEPALVINATSIGLTEEPQPEWMTELTGQLPPECFCFDMVYRKNGTLPTFARLAQEHGLESQAGLDMLIHQARLSFQYWTGVPVPFEVMKKAVL
ncbi:MAG: hypothetical protein C5B53_07575 [Candidatus Melainabacteria bacterium]|nr:MAG: hypothetical protein C5B53_07575 [Candidatus Melainabacteria bacterium]